MRERAQAWLHESSCVFVFLFFCYTRSSLSVSGCLPREPVVVFVAWLDVLRQNRWSLKGRFGSPSGSGCSPDLASLFWLNTEVGDQTALPDTASTLKCTENPDIIWFWCGVADYVLWSFRQKNPHNFIRIICCRDWGASLRILGGIRLNSAELHFTHFSRANRGEMWLWACEYESQASTLLSRFCELRV